MSVQLAAGAEAPPRQIEDLLAPSSRMLVLGILMPELVTTGMMRDTLLRLSLPGAGEAPVVCNARLMRKPAGEPEIRWVFVEASRREEAERRLMEMQRAAARRAEEFEREASMDSLTGIPNRRLFLSRFRPGGPPLDGALLLIDIDRFKSINDTLGHPAGDRAIRRTAEVVSASLRQGDLLARFGGEEFILWAPGRMRPEEALALSERIRRAVEEAEFDLDGRRVTVSIGVRLLEGLDPSRLAEAIEHADKALYAAKNSGRNRVVLSE